jgi:putative transposase
VYGGRHWLRPESHKVVVRDQLRALAVEFGLTPAAWVILDNHTHILVKSHAGPELNHFVGRWHGRTSFDLNRLDNARGRQIWHSFWDTCIRTEADYWNRFNYIHYNPIKHGYVSRLEVAVVELPVLS